MKNHSLSLQKNRRRKYRLPPLIHLLLLLGAAGLAADVVAVAAALQQQVVPPPSPPRPVSSSSKVLAAPPLLLLLLQNTNTNAAAAVPAVVTVAAHSQKQKRCSTNAVSAAIIHNNAASAAAVTSSSRRSPVVDDSSNSSSHSSGNSVGVVPPSSVIVTLNSRRAVLGAMVFTTAGLLSVTEAANAAVVDNEENASDLSSPSSTTLLLSDTAAAVAAPNIAPPPVPIEWKAVFQKASKKAIGGGKAGAAAAVVQVCSLMWLRTSMNYQYRYGGNLQSSLQTLWQQGGLGRLYQGLPFALLQGPLTRFGDTAANVGIFALLEALPATQEWPLPLKTACGSAAAGAWRIVLMPIDASKTSLQVEGSEGLQRLWASAGERGPGVLYRGAVAQAAATAVGHFPWFLTYNFLNDLLPLVSSGDDNALLLGLARSAVLGFTASCVSDCSSNSLRVIKTTKQTAQLSGEVKDDGSELSYPEVVKLIIEKDGVAGLFGRGLQTRLLTNAIQGAMFSILWKYFQQAA